MDDIERAAVMMLSMGEEKAAQVMKHMSPKQVEKVVQTMSKLGEVSREQMQEAMTGYAKDAQKKTGIGGDTEKFLKNTLTNALGEEKASKVIDRTIKEDSDGGIASLKWQDTSAIISLILDEHPQIIAVILTYLDNEQAADVLAQFPDKLRLDVMRRVARIGAISPKALQELHIIMENSSHEIRSFKKLPAAGAEIAANIINFMGGDLENEVMQDMAEFDENLSEKIQEFIFPFENLTKLDNRSMQNLLRDVSNDDLILALKGIEESMHDLFFNAMSERAAEMLKDDLEAQGPVQLSKVIQCQKNIVAVAQRLAKDGTIVIAGQGEEMV